MMMNRALAAAGAVLATMTTAATAIGPDADVAELDVAWARSPQLTVPRLTEAPTIDGHVNPREWSGALQLPPLIEDGDGRMDERRTHAYVGHTEQALYLAWRIHRDTQSPMRIGHDRPGRHEGRAVWFDDAVELFIDIDRAQQHVINLAANAAGGFSDRRMNPTDWEAAWPWDYETRETDSGWEGELAIPFEALGLDGPPGPEAVWGFDFWRNDKTPEAMVSRLSYGRRASDYVELSFSSEPITFRVLETGAIGDTSLGMLAELMNLTREPRTVEVAYGLYHLADTAPELNFLDEVDSGLETGEEDVAAFTDPGRQIAELLESFYEPKAQRRKHVTVEAGSRRPLNMTLEDAPTGDYVIAYRVTDDRGRVLSTAVIPAMRYAPMEVVATPYFLNIEKLDVALRLHTQVLNERTRRVALSLEQAGRTVAEETFGIDEAIEGAGLSTQRVSPGSYTLHIDAQDDADETLARRSESLYRPEPPDWAVQRHGTASFVPEPWTTVEASSDEATVWGRHYDFADGVLPAQMISQGEPLFTAAPRVVLSVDGERVAFEGERTLVDRGAEHALYRWEGRAGAVPVRAETRVEFDGFITVDLDMETSDVTVDRLFLEFPLASEHAGLYTLGPFFNERRGSNVEPISGGIDRAGAVGEGFATGFNHAVWLGSTERGLQWCAETAEHWHHADRAQAVEVEPTDDGTTLFRLRVIDRPTQAERLTYRWGLVASPTRPYDSGESERYIVQTAYHPSDYDDAEQVASFQSFLDYAHHEIGANWSIVHSWWSRPFHGQPYIEDEQQIAERQRLARQLRDTGLRTLFYAGWNGLRPNMEMWPFYGEAMRHVPTRFSHGAYKECAYGGYEDYFANGAVWLVEQFDIDGLFLDGTHGPKPCHNPYHGCGFVDPDTDQRIVTRDIWARRSLFKRLYKIFHGEVVDDGLIYSHGGRHLLAVTSFIDINHTGEGATMEDYQNLDFYLAQYNPTQFGVHVEHAWRSGHPVPRNFAWGVSLLHDNRLKLYPPFAREGTRRQRNTYEPELGIDWRMWVPLQWFAWDQPRQWHPYYANDSLVSVDAEDVHVSFHVNAANQLIFYAMNMSAQAERVSVQLDADALNLPSLLHGRDAVNHQTLEVHGGWFELEVLGHRPRVLMIGPEPIAKMGPGVADD